MFNIGRNTLAFRLYLVTLINSATRLKRVQKQTLLFSASRFRALHKMFFYLDHVFPDRLWGLGVIGSEFRDFYLKVMLLRWDILLQYILYH